MKAVTSLGRIAAVLQAVAWMAAAILSPTALAVPGVIDDGNELSALARPTGPRPNILFVIMDDVGIDQLAAMGYGGPDAPVTPGIDAIADNGLRFRNTWAQPECSNGRMALLTGRYPFRTQVYQAIGENDLANSHVSPYDVTVPVMLKRAGYRSALFGKYHLGGPENNQFENGGPGRMGWDYFYGWIGGLPASIDTTAGGVGEPGTYQCGYVPSTERAIGAEGADAGACYLPNRQGPGSCTELAGDYLGDSPGLACLNVGGILVPNAVCEDSPPDFVNFEQQNAHYVSPLVINRGKRVVEASLLDPRARNYRSSIEVNAAIRWIKARQKYDEPWMATVSFSADHTPLQPPPGHLLSPATREKLALALGAEHGPGTDCSNILVQRLMSDAMIEAMDSELSRLLISTGIAKRNGRGELVYEPAASNTLIVIVGDNGSLGNTVKLPFDALRSKATAYQTGVWVPLVVAGPMVSQPGRDVPHLTNAVDVFGLFGEVAGLNPQRVTAPHTIDSEPMLPYLVNPLVPSIRRFNFAQGGQNLQANGGENPPCVVGSTEQLPGSCSQTPVNKSVCEDNLGVWWGPGATDPRATSVVGSEGVSACWEVNEAIYNNDPGSYEDRKVGMRTFPRQYHAVRDDRFKLVQTRWFDYDPEHPGVATPYEAKEFYEVNESRIPLALQLDRPGSEIFAVLNGEETVNELDAVPGSRLALQTLVEYSAELLASEMDCPGDGNGDRRVTKQDVRGYRTTVRKWSGSSTFDFNHDGSTDTADLEIIRANLGNDCR